KRLDATAQVVSLAVNVTDKLFVQGKSLPASNVDTVFQSLTGALGTPLGNFMRLKGTYTLDYANYSQDKDTKSFLVPSDTFIQSPGVAWEFNRAAWTITASGQRSYRSRWQPWGDEGPLPCASPGSCLQEFDPSQKDFNTYAFGA